MGNFLFVFALFEGRLFFILDISEHGLSHAFLEDNRVELFFLFLKSIFNQLLEFLALKPVPNDS